MKKKDKGCTCVEHFLSPLNSTACKNTCMCGERKTPSAKTIVKNGTEYTETWVFVFWKVCKTRITRVYFLSVKLCNESQSRLRLYVTMGVKFTKNTEAINNNTCERKLSHVTTRKRLPFGVIFLPVDLKRWNLLMKVCQVNDELTHTVKGITWREVIALDLDFEPANKAF